ncbi:Homeodomain-like protein [Aspergillus unguis]
MNAPSRRRWWTKDEDRILQEEYSWMFNALDTSDEQASRNWSVIAEQLPERSNKDCRKRWTKISQSSRKGTWTGAEDQLLRKAVAQYGFRWTRVAAMVGSRHPDQCAKRWHHSLDPNVKRSPWTAEEDCALIEGVQRIGHDWKKIGSELFPRRSTTDIKNRHVILSRRQALAASKQAQIMDINLSAHITGPQESHDPSVQLVTDLSPYPWNADSIIPIDNDNILWEIDPWSAFDYQLALSPPQDIKSCGPRLLASPSQLHTPSIPDTAEYTLPSTLVLEDLRPETVNLVIDTLLQSDSKFGMRLYSTGS